MVERLNEAERADALDGLSDWDYDPGRDAITRGSETHIAHSVASSAVPTVTASVAQRTQYSAAGSCSAKKRGICRATFSGAPVRRRRARASMVDT